MRASGHKSVCVRVFVYFYFSQIETRCRFHSFENYIRDAHSGTRGTSADAGNGSSLVDGNETAAIDPNSTCDEKEKNNTWGEGRNNSILTSMWRLVGARTHRPLHFGCHQNLHSTWIVESAKCFFNFHFIILFFRHEGKHTRSEFCVNRSMDVMWYASRCCRALLGHVTTAVWLYFPNEYCVSNQNK